MQNNGHVINSNGWISILNILNEISNDSGHNYVNIGIKSMELLIN
jgi:hypothetical protein